MMWETFFFKNLMFCADYKNVDILNDNMRQKIKLTYFYFWP